MVATLLVVSLIANLGLLSIAASLHREQSENVAMIELLTRALKDCSGQFQTLVDGILDATDLDEVKAMIERKG
jgi:hypothetical protein